jgi:hypothetical protein
VGEDEQEMAMVGRGMTCYRACYMICSMIFQVRYLNVLDIFHVCCRYAAIIIHPQCINPTIQPQALAFVGKKQTVLYYETGQLDFASPSQLRPFLQHRDAMLAEVRSAKKFLSHVRVVEAGAAYASEDIATDKSARTSFTAPFLVAVTEKKESSDASEVAVSSAKPAGSKKTKRPAASPRAGADIPKVAIEKKSHAARAHQPGSDSDGEAECDFDNIDKEDDDEYDDEYVEEPKQKKQRSSSKSMGIGDEVMHFILCTNYVVLICIRVCNRREAV